MSEEHYKEYERTLDKANEFYKTKVRPSLKSDNILLAKQFLDFVSNVYDTGYEDGQAHPLSE